MKSMTAFGRYAELRNGKNYICEIKSVNNRYFDCSVKLPRQYGFLEEQVINRIREYGVSRGKLDVYISIEETESKGVTVSVDKEYADSYVSALKELCSRYGFDEKEINLRSVASNSLVFISAKSEDDEKKEWADLLPVLNRALDAYDAAKTAEGERLKSDLKIKKANLEEMTEKITKKSEENSKLYKEKLENRLRNTLGDLNMTFDSERILTEVAIFSDKIAVDEEMVRLKSHFKAFDEALESSEPVGRRLDFLIQEMNREVNTTGSKSCDAEITAIVVSAKCELEKIREQIQNLE